MVVRGAIHGLGFGEGEEMNVNLGAGDVYVPAGSRCSGVAGAQTGAENCTRKTIASCHSVRGISRAIDRCGSIAS